jgi:YMGG-like Gly-zipper
MSRRKKMKNSKRIVSMLLLIALSSIGLSAKAQRQSSRVNTRQVSDILQRLAQSSDRFRLSLNTAIEQSRADGRPENDINSFEREFANATNQLDDRFKRRRASAADVRNVLQKASPIDDFIGRRRFDVQTQNDWASVRSNLEALASAYAVNWHWNQQTLPPVRTSRSYRLSDRDIDQLIQRIETGGDTFRSTLTDAFDRSRYDQTRSEGKMNDAVGAFKNATDQLRNRFDARQSVVVDVEHLLEQAIPIDAYMRHNRLTDRAQNAWSTLRGDLEGLASAYNIAPSWENSPSPQTAYSANDRLTGTFRLDSSRSDDPRDVMDRATRNLSNNERQGVSDRLLARLEAPEMLAIELSGQTVTMASSRAPKSTFVADGREHQEQLSGGGPSRVTATLGVDQLSVRSTGYPENDFNITFESIENGARLRLRREIHSDRLNQPIVVNATYDRTSDVAQWNIYNGSGPIQGNTGASSGEFIVRDGETVVAVLNNDLSTKETRQGDRFTLTVREPGQYESALIEGTVGSVDQGGRLTGRSGMSLGFETIRLRNGQTYRFAGILASVRTMNDDTVKVDNEGSAQGDNQTTQTIQRAGIGTAIGAIIGAIAGGGKGAVIGAVVGAAGGAGSVYVQGKDNLELPSGTELTIRSTGPR